jgi:hypothetical protein
MAFDIKGAREAGYSESEILQHLAAERKFDIAGARKAGYTDSELLEHMVGLADQTSAASQIPSNTGIYDQSGGAPVTAPTGGPEPTAMEKVTGAVETARTVGTGATTGMVGMIGGTVKGLAGAVMDGTFGTQEGVRQVEEQAIKGMNALTYQPKTQSGQEQAAAVGKGMQALLPVAGLTAEMSAVGKGVGAAARAGADLGAEAAQRGAAGVQKIRAAAPQIAERVERIIRRNPDRAAPTPGTQASGGSAGLDIATQRTELAENLPVPIKLTRGQSERSFEQQRFERETAKDANVGGALRDRFAQQNEDIMKNFDAWVDQTGAEAASLRAVGESVDAAVVAKAARDKAEIRVAYKNAEKAGEMQEPVQLASVVEHLNESAPDAATAPLLDVARKRALQLGIATEGPDGKLVPQQVTIKTAETMRQAIGRATDYEATNIRQSAIIKGLIDAETESAGGAAYKAARRLRENYAKRYEDRAVISSLLNNKRGTADRKVAMEDVFAHSILKGSLDDVRAVRKVLQTGGEQGQQAWRDLQGQTMNWIKEEATKNVSTDVRGNAIVSADKLNKAIRSIDADGKMDFIFGKKGAQQLRDINDLAKVVFTSPPGAINSSNTASVLLAALTEAGAMGATTGLPVPVLSALRQIAVRVKNRQIQKRIEQALANRPANAPRPSPPPRTLH